MNRHTIIYTSDLHGNEVQYRKVVDYASLVKASSVIIGGDIAPKGMAADQYISTQRRFLRKQLPSILQPLKNAGIKVYLMMGNDDCKINLDVLEQESGRAYFLINNIRLTLTDKFEIIGYSYVPITPFGIKDWEKFDLSAVPEKNHQEYYHRKKNNYQLEGWKSSRQGWIQFRFTSEIEPQDSIQKDLFQTQFRDRPEKTIYVMHSPPNDTALDIISSGEHVGSIAERLFIEQVQPYLTLHGHIHEAVAMSGRFRQDIGKTICLASGNHNVGKNVAILLFDLYHPENVRRVVL